MYSVYNILCLSSVGASSALNDTCTISWYLDDIFNIDNPFFENMVPIIYLKELKLNKANTSDTSAAFLELGLSIDNGVISSKIYDKRDDFDFCIVNVPYLTPGFLF